MIKKSALTKIVTTTAEQLDIDRVSICLFNEDKTMISSQISL